MVNSDNKRLYEYSYSYNDWINFVNLYVFDETDRRIIIRHMLDNVPFEAIAEELQTATQTVKRRYKKSSQRLFERLIKEKKIAP